MKTKIITSVTLSGKRLAVVVTLNQTISETNDYNYHVMVEEIRNSLNRDNNKYIFVYNEFNSALDMYFSEVKMYAHHVALTSL